MNGDRAGRGFTKRKGWGIGFISRDLKYLGRSSYFLYVLCVPVEVAMQAIEFEADVEGGVIWLPQKFARLEKKHLKVFLLDTGPTKTTLPASFFQPITIPSYSLIAARDEIHVR